MSATPSPASSVNPAIMGALAGAGGLGLVQLLRKAMQSKRDEEENGSPSILNGLLLGGLLGGGAGYGLHHLAGGQSPAAAAAAPRMPTPNADAMMRSLINGPSGGFNLRTGGMNGFSMPQASAKMTEGVAPGVSKSLMDIIPQHIREALSAGEDLPMGGPTLLDVAAKNQYGRDMANFQTASKAHRMQSLRAAGLRPGAPSGEMSTWDFLKGFGSAASPDRFAESYADTLNAASDKARSGAEAVANAAKKVGPALQSAGRAAGDGVYSGAYNAAAPVYENAAPVLNWLGADIPVPMQATLPPPPAPPMPAMPGSASLDNLFQRP